MTDSETNRLTDEERRTLESALDALLPPEGSFPAPSETDMIDAFILEQVPPAGEPPPYPGLDFDSLREILARLGSNPDITAALGSLDRDDPVQFQALWALAVFGYYSRDSVTVAIQTDLAADYHGAPLPRGYAHVVTPWDAADSRQLPSNPSGRYIATDEVQSVDLSKMDGSHQ